MTLKDEVLADLRRMKASTFVGKYLFDRSPHVFDTRDNYVLWKEALAAGLEVDPAALTIVGSSAVGVSLNPLKGFSEFAPTSDIDVAVISPFHFQMAWRHLRLSNRRLYKLTSKQRAVWDDHKARLIYWGTVEADKLLPLYPFASSWMPASTSASNHLVGEREVKFRIYADYDALRSYQIDGVRKLQDSLVMGA